MQDAGKAYRPEQQEPIPPWLAYVDHTADAGITVWGENLGEVFARAAWGLFSLIADVSDVRNSIQNRVALEAPDLPALLVGWLSELNFRHVIRHELYSFFDIQRIGERSLEAVVGGEKIDPGRHVLHTEIKAVTFHGLELKPEHQGWRATVIFDL